MQVAVTPRECLPVVTASFNCNFVCCSFQAKYGDCVLVTKVKQKAEAVAEYTNAAQQGHTAALLQQQKNSRLYELKLGNLEAEQACTVELAYVQQLQSLAGATEFMHTATWVPPYVSAAQTPMVRARGLYF